MPTRSKASSAHGRRTGASALGAARQQTCSAVGVRGKVQHAVLHGGWFFEGDAGLAQFTDEKASNPKYRGLARKISYVIDPTNEYPRNYSGHIRVNLRGGGRIELDQPHMRGGKREPLTQEDIVAKFKANVAHGGWSAELGTELLDFCLDLRRHKDLTGLASFGR
jgi:hypothetical protein